MCAGKASFLFAIQGFKFALFSFKINSETKSLFFEQKPLLESAIFPIRNEIFSLNKKRKKLSKVPQVFIMQIIKKTLKLNKICNSIV
jgi:hypothetical protein